MYRFMITLYLLTCCTVVTGDDSVKFKPKSYKPAKELRSNTYEPKTYAPKKQTPSKTLDGTSTDFKSISGSKSLADKSMQSGKLFEPTPLEKQTAVDDKTYTSIAPLHASTITADKTMVSQEKKQFLISTNDSPFIVTERPKGRNPLLEPRQGIKAPEETPPTKDETK
jgi:hypothetical protein